MKYSDMSKDVLKKKIQELGFVLDDVGLFLDTHPTNQMALDFFRETQESYSEAVAEYEMKYGPLSVYYVNTDVGWTWTQGPWPWELED